MLEKEKKSKKKKWGIALFIIGWIIVGSGIPPILVMMPRLSEPGWAGLVIPICILDIIVGLFLVLYGLYLFFPSKKSELKRLKKRLKK